MGPKCQGIYIPMTPARCVSGYHWGYFYCVVLVVPPQNRTGILFWIAIVVTNDCHLIAIDVIKNFCWHVNEKNVIFVGLDISFMDTDKCKVPALSPARSLITGSNTDHKLK